MAETKLSEIVNRWRVRAGLIAAIISVFIAKPTPASLLAGSAVCLAGLLVRGWASGHLKKEKELATSGPYQYSRNPLYLGNFALGIGIALGTRSWWIFLIFVLYFLVFYPSIIRRERERMKELFPEKYEEYKKRVPLFFPSFRHRQTPSHGRFSWALYKKNKEYRALGGTLAFWLILVARFLLLNR